MAEEKNNISWEEATKSSGFVSLDPDQEKKVKLTNWRFEKRPSDANIAPNEIEFIADVTEEDGESTEEKLFTTTSKRLKQKLRPIFEGKNPTDVVALSVLRVGESFNTQYSCKEFTEN